MNDNEIRNSEFLCTYFSQTFDDLRFFKQKMNEVTHYLILIQGGLIGVFKLIGRCNYECCFVIISMIAATAALLYIKQTHISLINVRKTQKRIVEKADEHTKLVFYDGLEGEKREELKREMEGCCYQFEFTLLYCFIIVAGSVLACLAITHLSCFD